MFYETHKFIKINKPRFFIIENVKGLLSTEKGAVFNKWKDLLGGKSINGNTNMFPNSNSVPYHIHYAVLNAKDYGIPQNRERVFIVGVRDDVDNTFKWPKTEALNKKLKDVLEDEVDKKYYLSDVMIKVFLAHTQRHGKKGNGFKIEPEDEDIDYIKTITARYGNSSTDQYLKIRTNTKRGFEMARDGDSIDLQFPNSDTRRGRVGNGVASTLDTACNQGIVLAGTLKGGKWGKTHEQSRRVYNIEGTSPAIHTMGGGNQEPKILDKNLEIRKLTPRECFRLMDFPDTFDFSVVSNTQAYKQAGNSICVGVLERIINNLNI